MPGSNPPAEENVEVVAMYGAATKRGLVQIRLGAYATVVTPAKAREIAMFLIEGAGAAEGDEAMMKVLERIQADQGLVAQFLIGLRTERGKIDERARDEARAAIANDQFDPDHID